eukprot:CAMPEP_0180639434 /NCGR_PEP_ID=MMETSP1037_2-20121125/44999_1 /TAXON_ID=632150 /ORGANISM="Azadinium spinosum, Strain 3D9" /LENGTH=80 /DNA_ID=CAMNT_0022661315 /DNA_START=743 /DNA_END=985 /DNA_ORIENTATION=+
MFVRSPQVLLCLLGLPDGELTGCGSGASVVGGDNHCTSADLSLLTKLFLMVFTSSVLSEPDRTTCEDTDEIPEGLSSPVP